MPAANYDVRANLIVQARNSFGDVRKLGQEVRGLGDSLRTTQSAARAAVGQMVALGATVLGVRAISGAFVGLTRSAIGYGAELEKTKIGLQSVLMAVENTDWETAGRRAGAAFEKIRQMAIESPATSAEMFQIFNGIVGPIESAGFAMSKVLEITNSTTLAATALGVDLQQASRDIGLMVRGTAGMDVKLFSMLRSTGAIKEDAEAWNKSLTSAERVNKLSEALKKFSAGASAFGKSWAGVTSTLQDIFDNLKATAFGPIMKTVAANIDRFNQVILANRQSIEIYLLNLGRAAANRIETVFVKIRSGFEYVVQHWDQITERFHQVVGMVREVGPVIAKAALAWEATNLARNVAGAGLQAGGGLMNLIGGADSSGLAALLGGRAGAAAAGAAAPVSAAGALFGQMGGASGATSTAGLFGMMGAGATAGATGSGGGMFAGLAASLTALGPVLALVGAALVALLAVGLAFQEQWRNMVTIFGATGGQTVQMLFEFGRALWDALAPILKGVGSVLLVPLTALWLVFTTVLRSALLGFTWLLKIFGAITNAIYDFVKPAFDAVFGMFQSLAQWLNELFAHALSWLKSVEKAPIPKEEGPSYDPNTDYSRWLTGSTGNQAIDMDKIAKGAVNINQDFRGSRISVRQEFKGDQDPDRIVMAMMNDLTRQAENRVSSGYAGALTR